MKFIISSLLFACFVFSVNAQQATVAGSISGKIIDSLNHAPIDYATINVYHQESQTAITVIASDKKGDFAFSNLPYGTYSIVVGFIGYRPYTVGHILISTQNPVVVLSDILLIPTENTLKAVNITAQTATVQQKIDKLVYDPAKDLSAQGGTAVDVLKKVPTLTVDIDGNIELLGSPGVKFLINGKSAGNFGASLADALAAIPASQIKNIEVIASPGSRYDAQGTAGVINIILKDEQVAGINGTLNLSGGTRLNNGSFNLSVRKKKIGMNAFFSGNTQLNTRSENQKQLVDGTVKELLNQSGSSDIKRNGYQTGLNADWSISPNDNVTASIGYNRFSNQSADYAEQLKTSYDNDVPVSITSQRNAFTAMTAGTLEWSVGYKKKFARKDQALDILYQSGLNSYTSGFSQFQQYGSTNIPSSGAASNSPGKMNEMGIELNYVQPLGADFLLETGAKALLNTINSSVAVQLYDEGTNSYLQDALQSYNFNYDRNIYAGYLSASFQIAKTVAVKAGARYEYTVNHTDFPNTTIPDFGSLNPSILLSKEIGEAQVLHISFTRRLQRPEYDELNPFVNRSDPYNISSGNPNLRYETGNNFEIGYARSFKSGASLNISAYYRHNGDDIKNFTTFYPNYTEGDITYTNVSYSSRINTGGENRIGSNIFASIRLGNRLSLRSNLLITHKTMLFDYNGINQDTQGMEYRINLNAAYQFPHELSAEVFGNYNTPKVSLQGTNPPFFFYTLALKKQFAHKNASIGLSATDPFNQYIMQKSTLMQSGNSQITSRKVPYQSFSITLSYRFGNLKFSHHEDVKNEPEIPSY